MYLVKYGERDRKIWNGTRRLIAEIFSLAQPRDCAEYNEKEVAHGGNCGDGW